MRFKIMAIYMCIAPGQGQKTPVYANFNIYIDSFVALVIASSYFPIKRLFAIFH